MRNPSGRRLTWVDWVLIAALVVAVVLFAAGVHVFFDELGARLRGEVTP